MQSVMFCTLLSNIVPVFYTKYANLLLKYHDQSELEYTLKNVTEKHPSITHLYPIGYSVQGVPLWVLSIGVSPRIHQVGIPEVKYIANIHGNEPVGRELLLYFIEYLVGNYKHNKDIQALINSTRIHFLPALNPDGFKRSVPGDCRGDTGRTNFNDVDLNRNFPYIFSHNVSPLQSETLAAMQWFQSETFVLSATLHGGALVAVYPLSFNTKGLTGEAKAPDDEVFRYLARTYANTHKTMHKGNVCSDTFAGGITNAAEWYPILGCLQDYNYIMGQCLELTLEVSCCKYPTEDQLPRLWEENKLALLELTKQVHKGIKGRVLNSAGDGIPKAILHIGVQNRRYIYQANSYGEFYKILMPGKYMVQITAHGYLPSTRLVTVNDNIGSYSADIYDFSLQREEAETTGHEASMCVSCS
uniref:Peptidase M14 domain-containing protein n=1 Tax=Leptobrachium leishanense TaxID=445787 RepID=A0A8C5N1N0_9ANUR